ncbi:MAG: hypothetical protein MHM6MM_008778, partial [Cercozoa sp. M6MM]
VSDKELGYLSDLLYRVKARIVRDDMRDGTTDMHVLEALLPVVNSVGFARRVRNCTHGVAQPQLVFSHWEVVDEDPLWVPKTEEEREEWGHGRQAADQVFNAAKELMRSIRKRKGLGMRDEKLVTDAAKQRTRGKGQ